MVKAFKLIFSTSGGPKVTGINIGPTSVDPSKVIAVSFDQPLASVQDFTKLVRVSGSRANISQSGSSIQITLEGAPACTDFKLSISGDITSQYGVTEAMDWSLKSRTLCYTVSIIGRSVKGAAIKAYSFGKGKEVILFVGATHGDELSSGYILDRLIEDLEVDARSIPADKKVVIIPRVNPDGFASADRRNERNVDLSRNFPAQDWKSNVTMPGGKLVKKGGGSKSLSEPESKALADYTVSLRPKLVLTYHAVAGVVMPNVAGISVKAAKTYSRLSGYRYEPKSATGKIFAYDTTGAYEDWLHDKPGIAAILIELGSRNDSQYDRNKSAIWEMLRI